MVLFAKRKIFIINNYHPNQTKYLKAFTQLHKKRIFNLSRVIMTTKITLNMLKNLNNLILDHICKVCSRKAYTVRRDRPLSI